MKRYFEAKKKLLETSIAFAQTLEIGWREKISKDDQLKGDLYNVIENYYEEWNRIKRTEKE